MNPLKTVKNTQSLNWNEHRFQVPLQQGLKAMAGQPDAGQAITAATRDLFKMMDSGNTGDNVVMPVVMLQVSLTTRWRRHSFSKVNIDVNLFFITAWPTNKKETCCIKSVQVLHMCLPRFSEKDDHGHLAQQDANEFWAEIMQCLSTQPSLSLTQNEQVH